MQAHVLLTMTHNARRNKRERAGKGGAADSVLLLPGVEKATINLNLRRVYENAESWEERVRLSCVNVFKYVCATICAKFESETCYIRFFWNLHFIAI